MLPERTDVLVVGAGPTGLTVAATLAGHGVDVTVVDRLARPPVTSRAAVVHARTLEVLDRIGVAAPLVARGLRAPRFTVRDRDRVLLTVPLRRAAVPLPVRAAGLPGGDRGGARRAAHRARRAGAPAVHDRPASTRDDTGATVGFADGATVRARWVVGADGMHSTVRELAGIGFGGPAARGESFLLADVRVESALPRDQVVLFLARQGPLVWAPLPDGVGPAGRHRGRRAARPRRASTFQALLDERGPARRPDRVDRGAVGLAVPGPPPGRRHVPGRAGAARRRRRARAQPRRRPGDEPRHLRRGRPRRRARRRARRRPGRAARRLRAATRRPLAEEVVGFADRLTRMATVKRRLRLLRNRLLSASRLPAVRARLAWGLSGLAYR